MTERTKSIKSNLKKRGSYSVSSLNLFSDIQNYVQFRPRIKFSQMLSQSTLSLKKDYFTILFTTIDGTEFRQTHAVEDHPLRAIVKEHLNKYWKDRITDFNLFVDNSNTALPHDLATCNFVAGLTVAVKDIRTVINYSDESTKTKSGCNSSLSSLVNRRQDSLNFIEETEEEYSNNITVSVCLDEMVPAASEVCRIEKKSTSMSPRCRRLSSLHCRFTGKDERLPEIEDVKVVLEDKLGFIFNNIPSAEDYNLPTINEDWTSLLDEEVLKDLSEYEKSKQDAIWEMISTEVSFLRKMKLLLFVFVRPVKSIFLLNDFSLNNIHIEKVFTNIEEVYEANRTFWTMYLKPMYNKLRNSRTKLEALDLQKAFLDFPCLFKPYMQYITDQNMATEYFKELYKKNDIFRYIIEYCERKSTERLSYLDLFIQPMQRLTKYKLLLQAILKRSSCATENYELSKMVGIVEDFVRAANSALYCIEQKNRIEDVMQRIAVHDSYLSPPELQNFIKDRYKSNCWIDLADGMSNDNVHRQVIHHGMMKLKDHKEKLEVYCYLLTDMFFILRWKKNCTRLKLHRGPIMINRIDACQFADDSRATCFAMIIKGDFDFVDSGYIFYSNHSRMWIKYIEEAKKAYMYGSNALDVNESPNESRVLYSFQPSRMPKIKRRCTTNSCQRCGIKSKDEGDEDDILQNDVESFSNCYRLDDYDFGSSNMVIPEESRSTEHLETKQIVNISPRVCSIDDLIWSATNRYSSERPLNRASTDKRAIFLSFLQREDSLMSTGSKKSSSGVSSSNGSLLNILEDIL